MFFDYFRRIKKNAPISWERLSTRYGLFLIVRAKISQEGLRISQSLHVPLVAGFLLFAEGLGSGLLCIVDSWSPSL